MDFDLASLVSRMEATRGALLEAIEGLPPRPRDDERWYGDWTVKDIVCHIAAWEEGWALAIEALVEGQSIGRPPRHSDESPFNERTAHAHRYDEWDEAIEYLEEARQRLLGALFEVELLEQGGETEAMLTGELVIEADHEEEHARAIAAWRKERGL